MSIIWRLFVLGFTGMMAFGAYSYLKRPPADATCSTQDVSTVWNVEYFRPDDLKLIRVYSRSEIGPTRYTGHAQCATDRPFDLHLTGKMAGLAHEVRYLPPGHQFGEPYQYMDSGYISEPDAELLRAEQEAMVRAIIAEKPFREEATQRKAVEMIAKTARQFNFTKLSGFAVMVGKKQIVRGDGDQLIATDGTRLARKLDGLTVVFK